MLPCILFFGGCSEEVYVLRIEKTETIGNVDTYTIYYSNNTTSNFTIENGTDGEDGEDLTIEAIFNALVERGEYPDTSNESFKAFLSDYLNITYEEDSVNKAVVNAMPSVVNIYAEQPEQVTGGSFPYFTVENESQIYCGSGVIYQMDDNYSYIITNYHVVYSSTSILDNKISRMIYAYQYGKDVVVTETSSNDAYDAPTKQLGGEGIECEYIGGSMNYDIAVLRVSTSALKEINPDAKAVTVADGYSLADTAIAIGNPEGDGISVTSGVISVESEYYTMVGADEETVITFRGIRIDTAVNGGNSGGGLFNIKGELIGIVNSKLVYSSDGTPIDNIAHALPYDNVVKVADNIIDNYKKNSASGNSDPVKVTKLTLGLSATTENSQTIYDYISGEITITEDTVVTSFSSNSLAQSRGMQVGDIITSVQINETEYEITRYFQLNDLMLTVRENDQVIINISRNHISQSIVIGEISSSMLTTVE